MGLAEFIEAFGLRAHLAALMIGLPRLLVLVTLAPFMGGRLLSGQLKAAVVFAFYLMLHPLVYSQVPPAADFSGGRLLIYLGLAAKEALIGFIFTWSAGLAFWAVQSAGFLMDNQRGASMASGADPISGEETSPLGSLFFQFMVLMFFMTGAFAGFLSLFYLSYQFWPVFDWWPNFNSLESALFFSRLADWLMTTMALLAGPVVVAALLTDMALGLINRFASQLNVYVLAMPIKSGLTMFIVLVYINILVRQMPGLFDRLHLTVLGLRDIWP